MENGHPDQHKQVIKKLFSLTVRAKCSSSLPPNRFCIEHAVSLTVLYNVARNQNLKSCTSFVFILKSLILHLVSFGLLSKPCCCLVHMRSFIRSLKLLRLTWEISSDFFPVLFFSHQQGNVGCSHTLAYTPPSMEEILAQMPWWHSYNWPLYWLAWISWIFIPLLN